MKRYLCLGGEVYGNSTHTTPTGIILHEKHYIPARKLPRLYNVPRNECIFADREEELRSINIDGLLVLKPCSSGNYNLPIPEEIKY